MQLLFLSRWLSEEMLKALGWTFIHSLWQGLLAAVLAAIIIISTRKAAARLRYNLLGFVMIVFLISTGITFYNEMQQEVVKAPVPVSLNVIRTGDNYFTPVIHESATEAAPPGIINGFISWFNDHADIFIMLWLLFFIINCLKLFTGLAGIHRLRNYKIHPASEKWITKLEQLSITLGIRQQVSLLQSELVKVPVAVGFLKPVILVPMGLLTHLPPEQVETILLHELAHIRRQDYFVNIFQRFAEAIFFFNPALVWISSLIRQEREACCDDIVVANTRHRRSYLDALVAFQEYASVSPAYAMGIGSKRHYLLERVKRMITKENRKLGWMERIALLAGIILLTAFTFISATDNVKEKNDKQTATAQETIVKDKVEQKTASQKAIEQKTIEHKVGTSVPVERVKPLKLQQREIRNMISMAFQPRDTPRIKIAPVIMPVQQARTYIITDYSKHVDANNSNSLTKERTQAIGPDGKKYRIQKSNGEVTALFINNKKVPENEMASYGQLLVQVENTRIANSPRLPTEKEWKDAAQQAETNRKITGLQRAQQQMDEQRQLSLQQRQKVDLLQSSKLRQINIDSQQQNIREVEKGFKKEIQRKMDSTFERASATLHENMFALNDGVKSKLFSARSSLRYTPREPHKKIPPSPPKPIELKGKSEPLKKKEIVNL